MLQDWLKNKIGTAPELWKVGSRSVQEQLNGPSYVHELFKNCSGTVQEQFLNCSSRSMEKHVPMKCS